MNGSEMELSDRLALRVKDAIPASGLGMTMLYELMKTGQLPYVKVGNARLIMRSDLEAFLQRHRVTEAA